VSNDDLHTPAVAKEKPQSDMRQAAKERTLNAERALTSGAAGVEEPHVRPRSRTLNGGLDPVEMGQKSGQARREKKIKREETAAENALTVRQKVGVALSRLTQREWDAVVKGATVAQRVALMNQAFGTPTQAEEDKPQDEGLAALTREQRAVLMEALDKAEDAPPQDDPPSSAQLEPLVSESPGPRAKNL
jgi:hypothetical protein